MGLKYLFYIWSVTHETEGWVYNTPAVNAMFACSEAVTVDASNNAQYSPRNQKRNTLIRFSRYCSRKRNYADKL